MKLYKLRTAKQLLYLGTIKFSLNLRKNEKHSVIPVLDKTVCWINWLDLRWSGTSRQYEDSQASSIWWLAAHRGESGEFSMHSGCLLVALVAPVLFLGTASLVSPRAMWIPTQRSALAGKNPRWVMLLCKCIAQGSTSRPHAFSELCAVPRAEASSIEWRGRWRGVGMRFLRN